MLSRFQQYDFLLTFLYDNRHSRIWISHPSLRPKLQDKHLFQIFQFGSFRPLPFDLRNLSRLGGFGVIQTFKSETKNMYRLTGVGKGCTPLTASVASRKSDSGRSCAPELPDGFSDNDAMSAQKWANASDIIKEFSPSLNHSAKCNRKPLPLRPSNSIPYG